MGVAGKLHTTHNCTHMISVALSLYAINGQGRRDAICIIPQNECGRRHGGNRCLDRHNDAIASIEFGVSGLNGGSSIHTKAVCSALAYAVTTVRAATKHVLKLSGPCIMRVRVRHSPDHNNDHAV